MATTRSAARKVTQVEKANLEDELRHERARYNRLASMRPGGDGPFVMDMYSDPDRKWAALEASSVLMLVSCRRIIRLEKLIEGKAKRQ
jgi:hypothetical protein